MKGSEKQLKWVNELKKIVDQTISEIKESGSQLDETLREEFESGIALLEQKISSIPYAGIYIDCFKDITRAENFFQRCGEIILGIRLIAMQPEEREHIQRAIRMARDKKLYGKKYKGPHD